MSIIVILWAVLLISYFKNINFQFVNFKIALSVYRKSPLNTIVGFNY